MKRKIVILTEAAFDIELAIDFYDRVEPGVGSYFRDPSSPTFVRLSCT